MVERRYRTLTDHTFGLNNEFTGNNRRQDNLQLVRIALFERTMYMHARNFFHWRGFKLSECFLVIRVNAKVLRYS